MLEEIQWARCAEAGQETSVVEGNDFSWKLWVCLRSSNVISRQESGWQLSQKKRGEESRAWHASPVSTSEAAPSLAERLTTGLRRQRVNTSTRWKMVWLLRKRKGQDWHRRLGEIYRDASSGFDPDKECGQQRQRKTDCKAGVGVGEKAHCVCLQSAICFSCLGIIWIRAVKAAIWRLHIDEPGCS